MVYVQVWGMCPDLFNEPAPNLRFWRADVGHSEIATIPSAIWWDIDSHRGRTNQGPPLLREAALTLRCGDRVFSGKLRNFSNVADSVAQIGSLREPCQSTSAFFQQFRRR